LVPGVVRGLAGGACRGRVKAGHLTLLGHAVAAKTGREAVLDRSKWPLSKSIGGANRRKPGPAARCGSRRGSPISASTAPSGRPGRPRVVGVGRAGGKFPPPTWLDQLRSRAPPSRRGRCTRVGWRRPSVQLPHSRATGPQPPTPRSSLGPVRVPLPVPASTWGNNLFEASASPPASSRADAGRWFTIAACRSARTSRFHEQKST